MNNDRENGTDCEWESSIRSLVSVEPLEADTKFCKDVAFTLKGLSVLLDRKEKPNERLKWVA